MIRNLLILCMLLVIASCKSPEARKPITTSSGTFIKKSAERNKKIYQQEASLIASIIEADTVIEYVTSNSGFWYYYNTKDTLSNTLPKIGDKVTFTYNVRRLNGDIIITEQENGLQNYKIDQSNQDLISGLRDGLKLMKVGETVTFLLPSYKAYGYYGIKNKLGTNIPIQSTVTLKTIETQEN